MAVKYFTYQNVARWNYINALGWLATMMFDVDTFAFGVGLSSKHFESKDMGSLLNGMRAMCATFALYWIALSQCSDSCIRKHLQYNLPSCFTILATMFYNRDIVAPSAIQMNVIVQLVTFGATLFCLYGCHSKPSQHEVVNSRLTNASRYFYVIFLAGGIWGLADIDGCAAMFGAKFEGKEDHYMATIFSMCLMSMAMLTIATAQASHDDQKKIFQYQILATFAWYVALIHNGDMILAGKAPWMLDFMWNHLTFNLFLRVWANYPAGWKTWIFRIDYLSGFGIILCLFFNPKLVWTMWKSTEFSAEASAFIAGLLAIQVMGSVAAAQLSSDIQRKFLQYNMIAKVYFLVLCLSGKLNMGIACYMAGGLLVLTYLVLYTPESPAFNWLRDDGSAKAPMRSSSPMRSPRRSRTPMKKRQ